MERPGSAPDRGGFGRAVFGDSPEGPYFHADSTTYLAPGNMVERINAGLRAAGFAEEKRPPELAAIIFRSLARRYAEVVGELATALRQVHQAHLHRGWRRKE